MGDYLGNPALLDPTNFSRRYMQPMLLQQQQGGDLLAPAATAAAAQPEPVVNLAQELQPYQDRVNSSAQAYQQGLEHQAQMQYPQPSVKRTILGWLAGQAIPQLGDQIINGPQRKYLAEMDQSQHQLGALHNAAQDALRELNTARETRRDTAYIDWMGRRQPTPHDPRTVEVVGPDGKPHLMQFNVQSGRYDIDAGPAFVKQTPDNNLSEWEVRRAAANGEKWAIDALRGHRSDAAAGNGGAHGSYIPLLDNQGHLTGAWNPTTNNTRPVPQGYEGSYKTPPNGQKDYFTAQREALKNLGNSIDYVAAEGDEQAEMLEAETQRILKGAQNYVHPPQAETGGDQDLLAPVQGERPVASHAPTQFRKPAPKPVAKAAGVRFYKGHPYKQVNGQWERQD